MCKDKLSVIFFFNAAWRNAAVWCERLKIEAFIR